MHTADGARTTTTEPSHSHSQAHAVRYSGSPLAGRAVKLVTALVIFRLVVVAGTSFHYQPRIQSRFSVTLQTILGMSPADHTRYVTRRPY